MRVPGRKESGVIFTTVTGVPPNERLERSERERPSGSGLQRSKDETVGSERAGSRCERRRREKRTREGTKKTKGNGDTGKHSTIVEIIKADMNFKAERNVECGMYVQKCNLVSVFTAGVTRVLLYLRACQLSVCVRDMCDLTCSVVDVCGAKRQSLRKACAAMHIMQLKQTDETVKQCLQTDRQTWAQLCMFTSVNTAFAVQ